MDIVDVFVKRVLIRYSMLWGAGLLLALVLPPISIAFLSHTSNYNEFVSVVLSTTLKAINLYMNNASNPGAHFYHFLSNGLIDEATSDKTSVAIVTYGLLIGFAISNLFGQAIVFLWPMRAIYHRLGNATLVESMDEAPKWASKIILVLIATLLLLTASHYPELKGYIFFSTSIFVGISFALNIVLYMVWACTIAILADGLTDLFKDWRK